MDSQNSQEVPAKRPRDADEFKRDAVRLVPVRVRLSILALRDPDALKKISVFQPEHFSIAEIYRGRLRIRSARRYK